MLDHPKPVRIRAAPERTTPWIVMVLATFAWTITYAIRGVLEYTRFHTHTFDLGIFAQGTWLLSQAKAPFVTLRGLHLFADHSSYILVLVAPIYALFPNAGTLIVLTVLALGASSPIAFSIALRAGAGPFMASVTALLLLLSPAVQWLIHGSFHPEVFVIPLALAAVALLQIDRSGWAIAAVILSLTVKEDVGLLIVPLGLAVAFILGKRRVGATFVVLGSIAFVVNFLILLPAWSPTGELLYSHRYGHLGDSLPGIIGGLATSPEVWWETLTSLSRIGYVAALVLAMPLCFLGWRWLLVGIPVLAANVLSLHWYQYSIRSHYTAYLVVVVAIAAAYGAARFDAFGPSAWRRPLIVVTTIVPVALWLLAGPITVWAPADADSARIEQMLAQIPPHATVSATTAFTPQLANRETVYLFPNPWESLNYGATGTESPNPASVEWVAVRSDAEQESAQLIESLTSSGEFVVVHEDPPFLLLRRVSS